MWRGSRSEPLTRDGQLPLGRRDREESDQACLEGVSID